MPGTAGHDDFSTEPYCFRPSAQSARIHAAVDDELRPRHVARGIGRQIQHALRDLLGVAGTAERRRHFRALLGIDRRVLPGARGFRRDLAPDRRVDDAGMHRVDADAVAEGGAFHRDRLRKQPHAALGRAIAGKTGRAAQARQRRHHDDGAAAGLAHRRQAMLHRQKHAVEIDRGLPPPVRQRHLGDRRHGDTDAGVRDQHVEPAVALHHLGHDLDPALFAGDVVMQKGRLPARLLDPRDDLRALQIVDIGHRNRGAFARQQLGNRFANAGCAARHQRDLALNLPCHFLPRLLLLVVEST